MRPGSTLHALARDGSSHGGGFDSQGYPVSPGGTVIRPPPGPPPMCPRVGDRRFPDVSFRADSGKGRFQLSTSTSCRSFRHRS